uniref:Uncharacterized protein n=1 Tax=Vespula pensylvanica TaxID=30213 RepID=A0A834P709_VESPE|nr:hypothetical protein H0235_004228 [Vespula pensylvanica]
MGTYGALRLRVQVERANGIRGTVVVEEGAAAAAAGATTTATGRRRREEMLLAARRRLSSFGLRSREFVVYRELSCFIEFQADKMRLEEPILPRAFDFLITCHKLADTLGPFQDSLFSGWPQVRSTTSVLWDELQAGSFVNCLA